MRERDLPECMKKPDYRTTVRNRILPYREGSAVSPYGPIYRKGREGTVYGKVVIVRGLDREHRHPGRETACASYYWNLFCTRGGSRERMVMFLSVPKLKEFVGLLRLKGYKNIYPQRAKRPSRSPLS
jgi:hypothetical protein